MTLPEPVIYILRMEPLPPGFDQVSEKYNGWITKFWIKRAIFAYLGHFVVFLTLLSPWERNENYSQ